MNLYKIIIGILTLLYAYFIFSYPASYFNDDSLFFVRGIDEFSVIDFSPHFPGYPFIILAGKFINLFIDDSKFSLFLLTSICAIILPLILFLYVKELLGEKVAFITFLLAISSPYLMNLSLSMLSDSVGLLFLFLGLYLIQVNKDKSAGVILSIALFSRPSYLIFFLIGFIYLFINKRDSLKKIVIYFLITSLFFIVYIFLTNGMLYLYEAKRFIIGHFFLWGTGQNSDIAWIDNILILANLPFLFLIYIFFNYEKKLNFLSLLFLTYTIWILLAQNPENIRHIIPVVFIATIFIAKSIENRSYLIVVILLFNMYISFSYNEKLSPIDQIIKVIDEKERVILSNRSIEILRKELENRVSDSYYIHNSKYLLENKKVYLITTKKTKREDYSGFSGRFLGEHTYYLLKN